MMKLLCCVVWMAFVLGGRALPVFSTQPSPRTNSVSLGVTISNKVGASSTAGGVTYQWRHEGTNLPGRIATVLTLTNITTLDAGAYTAVALDAAGEQAESLSWTLDVDPTFRKVTTGPMLTLGNSGGVSWGDINNDGFPELVVCANPVNVFSNQLGTNFVRVSSTFITSLGYSGNAVWADYDNDGWTDLVAEGYTGCTLAKNGGGFFKSITGSGLNSGNTFMGAWADYDRDGFVDIFFTCGFNRAVNSLYRNTNGVFKLQSAAIVSKDTAEYSQGPSWCDYDNDGWPDLFVANARDYNTGAGRQSFLYHNNHGVFEKVRNVITTNLFGLASGIWGDYDNDGLLDLFASGYMMSNAPQARLLFRNTGDGNFERVTGAGSICTDVGYDQGAAFIDYDNDGWLDVFITTGGPGAFNDALYHNNGDGTFTRVRRGSLVNDSGEGAGCAWADFNRDGFLDLYVTNFQNQNPEKNGFYINNGNANHWLEIKCEGRISNRSAIGAKVRLRAKIGGREFWQLREISSNGGYMSATTLEAHFGLGDAVQAEEIRIEWPSGIVQQIGVTPANQFLNITEPFRMTIERTGDSGLMINTEGRGEAQFERSTNLLDWEAIGSRNDTNRVINLSTGDPEAMFYRLH